VSWLRSYKQQHFPSSPSPNVPAKGREGAVIWEVNDSSGAVKRFVYAMNDGGRWEFASQGDPFPFEELSRYSAPRIRDRFNLEVLGSYLAAQELYRFRDDWFANDGSTLVTRVGGHKQVSLTPASNTVH
jgi:hypothetical protein